VLEADVLGEVEEGVDLDPALAGCVIEGDRAVLLREAQREAHGVAQFGELGAVERSAERQQL
jgi:hypothetical protein